MQKLIKESATITVNSKGSEDGNYRYTLTKTWDGNGLRAVVVGINPSKATHLKGDNTVTNAMNFLIDCGYGEMTIVNLFPYRCVDPSGLTGREKKYDDVNLEHIKKVCAEADMVLVVWGYEKKYLTQKKKVENLLMPYMEKVKCFRDCDGNKPRHLRIFKNDWEFINYF